MRLAVVSLLFMLSTPLIGREPLTADQVGRFVAAAEEVLAAVPPDGREGLAHNLLSREEALAAAARHGFGETEWRQVGLRVMAAHKAARLGDLPEGKGGLERKLASMPSLSSNERDDLLTVLSMAERDRKLRAEEAAPDQVAVAPYLDRLDGLADQARP